MEKRGLVIGLLFLLFTIFIQATEYENAEDGKTDGWSTYSKDSDIATITNIQDNEKNSKVISLNRNGGKSSFVLGHWENSKKWNNQKDTIIKWSMKFNKSFIVYVSLDTTDGQRYMMYRPRDNYNGTLKNGEYIYHGIGTDVYDGTWQTITRDLEADLKKLQPNNSIISVNSFQVAGEGLVDDISLLSKKEIYENAEDGKTDGWSTYSKDSDIATITNIQDNEKNSKVISLNRNGGKSSFVLGHWKNSKKWNNQKDTIIKWSMKFNKGFIVYVSLDTTDGQRYMMYRPRDNYNGTLKNGEYIYHGIGTDVYDGTWQTITRDLEADLKKLQPNNSIISVNSFQVGGEGLVDDIALISTDEINPSEDTTPPVITLNGESNVTVEKDGTYNELNATAIDDVDGEVNVAISGTVDTASVGVYTITYTATDSSNNSSTKTRTVNVEEGEIPDTIPPVITLNGDATITLTKGNDYNELGATAVDDVDGSVNVMTSGEVDSSTVGTYTITYTAKDSSNNESNLTREVNVLEVVVEYGVKVGEVRGTTVKYHSMAKFDVSLKSQPESSVTIPLSSSDTNEGKVISLDGDNDKLIFTPDNWNQPQTVYVQGQNRNVVDGVQHYTVILNSIISDDDNYDGINPNDVEIKGLILTLSEPMDTSNFIATLPKILCIDTLYNGNEDLNYTLSQKPDGMTIDDETGCVMWEAPLSEEGNTHTVTINVSDSIKSQIVSFDVHISQTEVLESEVNGNIVSITAPNTTLNGVKFRFLGDNPDIPTIRKVEKQSLPTVRDGIQVLSDYFYADYVGDVEVLIPVSMLNDIYDFPRLSLYYFVKKLNYNKPVWNRIGLNLKVEVIDGTDYGVLSVYALKSILFIGIRAKTIGTKVQKSRKRLFKQVANPAIITVNDINCTAKPFFIPKLNILFKDNYETQICKINVDGLRDITYTVEEFGDSSGKITHWKSNSTIEEMMVWVGEARSEFNMLGIGNVEKDIRISIEKLDDNRYGEVRYGVFDDGETLYLNNGKNHPFHIQYTIAHEYFHHAQIKTRLPITGNILYKNELDKKLWLIESTAEWFADYLYDSKNYYLNFSSVTTDNVINRFLDRSGLLKNDEGTEYTKMMMIKLFSEKCTNFESRIKHLFYANFQNDDYAIKNVASFLSNPSTECNFGNVLGGEKKTSLETALLYYMYATRQEKNIKLIDSVDESEIVGFFNINTYKKNAWSELKSYVSDFIHNKPNKPISPYCATSFKLNYDDINDANKTKIKLSIKTDKPLTVVGLRLDENGKGLPSRIVDGVFNHLEGDFSFTTEAGVLKEYNLTEENVQGGLFITLLNATGEEVNILDMNLTEESKGVIIDEEAGLMWQDFYPEPYGRLSSQFVFSITYCRQLDIAGYDDWRVPKVNELEGMYNHGIKNKFINTPYSEYWSTTFSHKSNAKWYFTFDFSIGRISKSKIRNRELVICVRNYDF